MSTEPTPQPPADPWLGAFASLPPPPQPSTPPPGWKAPSPARPKKRSRVAPWIGVGLTLAGLVTASSVLGAPAAPPDAGANRWLPPDGTRLAYTTQQGVHTVEWSRPTVHSLMQFNSPTFLTWANISETDWTAASYLRVASQRLDDQAAAVTTGEDLWVIDDTGARTIAESTSDVGDTVWEPGRLDLPADLAVGKEWESEGAVAFRPIGGDWQAVEYRAVYQASPPADADQVARGCVAVAMTVTINQQDTLAERTWCPGAGPVAGSDPDLVWTLTEDLPRLTPAEPAAFDWDRADQLEFTTRVHSLTGAGNTFVSPVSPPGLVPSGLVFANKIMPDVLTLDPADDPPQVRWAARPGGTPLASATFDGLTVVSTSQRRLVAYGPDGQWLWQAPQTDLTQAAPVRLGADTVVVVTLDGGVTGYDLITGAQKWRADMAVEIHRPPVAAGDRLLVSDQGGALTCFDAAGAELWTIDAGQVSSLAVTDGPDPLVVVGRADSYVVRAYRLADGEPVWRTRIVEDARGLVAIGDRVVLRDSDRLLGLDVATGETLWTQVLRNWAVIGGGDRLLALTDDALVLLDADGRRLKEWPVQLGDVESVSYLTIAADAVLVYGPTGFAVGRPA